MNLECKNCVQESGEGVGEEFSAYDRYPYDSDQIFTFVNSSPFQFTQISSRTRSRDMKMAS